MKHRILIIAALLAASASAHVCDGLAPTGPSIITEAAPEWASLPCTPDLIGGTGKAWSVRANAAGATAWLWCPNGSGWALRWGAWTWEQATMLLGELPAALAALDKRAALEALETGSDLAGAALRPAWCPWYAEMLASRPLTQWIVAPAAASASPPGTRPAYPWANGTRGTVSNGRATAGAPCSPSVGRVEGSTAYYGVNNRTDQVAVCVRQ